MGELILMQDIFPMPHVITGNVADTPLLAQPRLEVVFFSTRRTLSREIDSVTASSTSLSAINWSVQRLRPDGAVLQASIVTLASTRLSKVIGRPLRGASW